MANIIQIKRGENAPTIDVLEDYELGYCIDEKALYINDNGTIQLAGLPLNGGNITGSLTIQGNNIYHEGNKPTKADIGLGEVNNWGASTSVSSTSTTTYATASAVKSAYDRGTAGVNAAATKLPLSGGNITGSLTIQGNNIYHVGNKPTKSDIGLGNVNNWGASTSVSSTSTTTYATSSAVKEAYDMGTAGVNAAATKLPLSGGTLSGSLTINGNLNITGSLEKAIWITDSDNFVNNFRLLTKGNTASGSYIQPIRMDTSQTGSPEYYSTGLSFGSLDTHGWIGVGYNQNIVVVGGGASGKLYWTQKLYNTGYKNISYSTTFSGSASSASATGTFIIFTATPSTYSDPVSCCLSLKNTTVQVADNESWSSFTWNGTTLSRNGGGGLIKNVQSFTIQ